MQKIILSIFLTMKATILDTHGIRNRHVDVAVGQLIAQKTTVREDLGSTPSNGTFRG